jgi:uncharacterized oxidoreductase
MPIFKPEELKQASSDIFQAAGAPKVEADLVADFLVRANLAGHDSHGVIRVPQYVGEIKAGHLIPGAPIKIVQETPSTALIDGNWGFGQVIAKRATEIAIEKARTQKISIVNVYNSNHIGRLGDYPHMAAQQDMIGIIMVNAGGAGQSVAPFGGTARRLATNPISIAVPTGGEVPLILDMATSVVAEGKVRVKRNRKQKTPDGWLIGSDGNPTNDPEALYANPPRAAILPLGGLTAGHKGYGLAFMIEILTGILARNGYSNEKASRISNGTVLIVIDVATFIPVEEFKHQVLDLIRYIKTSPCIPGVNEILVPGEPEYKEEKKRLKEGIFVEDETWNQIKRLAEEFGVKSLPSK